MKVYRLENSFGEGPFTDDSGHAIHLLIDHKGPHNQLPFEMVMYVSLFHFAWSTEELMFNFIKGDTFEEKVRNWEIMNELHGFHVKEYETNGNHVILEDGQVMFIRGDVNEYQLTIIDMINSSLEDWKNEG